MRPRLRKFALTVHVTFSVGWIGGVVAYLTLGVASTTSENVQIVRAAWTAMELIGWFAIVPLALVSLLTGLVMSLGTNWGLFQHYWTLISFVLTTLATIVLLLHMPDVSLLVDAVQEADGTRLDEFGGDLFHSGLGLVVLLVIQVLNVYKPRGLTRYGWRKKRDKRLFSQAENAET